MAPAPPASRLFHRPALGPADPPGGLPLSGDTLVERRQPFPPAPPQPGTGELGRMIRETHDKGYIYAWNGCSADPAAFPLPRRHRNATLGFIRNPRRGFDPLRRFDFGGRVGTQGGTQGRGDSGTAGEGRRGGSPMRGRRGKGKGSKGRQSTARQSTAVLCCDSTPHHIKAEPSQAEPSQAKPSQAKPSRAKPSQAEPTQAEPKKTKKKDR